MTRDDYCTADVATSYNRRGQVETIDQGGATTTLNYSLAGQLLSEAYTGGPLSGLRVTNGYDHLLRRTNLTLLSPSGAVLATTAYGYDSASRLATVKSVAGSEPSIFTFSIR